MDDVPAARAPWHILYVITSSDFGGAETGVLDLALRLRGKVFETGLCSLRPPGQMARQAEIEGIPLSALNMSEKPRPWQLVRAVVQLARIIDEQRIDLVHSCLYRANSLAGLAARVSRRRPKVVSAQHSLAPTGDSRSAALAARWTRRLSACIIAVSAAVKEELTGRDRVPAERIVVIENGIDTARFMNLDARHCRRQLGLAEEGLVVVGVGRLAPVKRFENLIESVRRLRASGVDVRLLLAGDGPERSRLEQLSRISDLEDRVLFLGVRRDMETVFGAADIFALTSLREASPAALLEAMASGCAIVATRVGGVPEIVEDGVTGLLADPSDLDHFTTQLQRVARDGELRRQLSREARSRAQRRFDAEVMVRRHAGLYRTILTGGDFSSPAVDDDSAPQTPVDTDGSHS